MRETIDKEAIADDPLPSTGINRDSLAAIFDAETETPAAGRLSNRELSQKTGTSENTIASWKRRDKKQVRTAKDGSMWRLGDDDLWYAVT